MPRHRVLISFRIMHGARLRMSMCTLEGGSRGWVGLGYVVRGTTKNNPGNESLKVLRRVAWVSGETLH